MANVFFFNLPGASGHINPTVGLVSALIAHGEHIVYYAGEDSREKFTALGCEFRNYSPWFDYHHNPQIGAKLIPMALAELDMMERCIEDLIEIARNEKVDYIIYDACCIWGKYMAQALGIPGINILTTLVSSPWIPFADFRLGMTIAGILLSGAPRVIPKARRQLIDVFSRIGTPYHGLLYHIFDVFACVGDLNIVFNTREFQPFVNKLQGNFHFVGASIPERRDVISEEFQNLGKKPLVYVSLGTLHNDKPEFFRNCIQALKDSSCEVIISIGKSVKAADLGPLPAHIKVYPFVPQLHILKHASAFVTHGGMNSLNEGLYFGVPVIVCPQQIEQAFNGRRLQKIGVAKTLGTSNPSVEQLKSGIESIINNTEIKQRTAAYGKTLQAAGGYCKAADLIIDFVKRSSPHTTEETFCLKTSNF